MDSEDEDSIDNTCGFKSKILTDKITSLMIDNNRGFGIEFFKILDEELADGDHLHITISQNQCFPAAKGKQVRVYKVLLSNLYILSLVILHC